MTGSVKLALLEDVWLGIMEYLESSALISYNIF